MASKEAIQSAVAEYFGAVSRMDANAVAEAFAPDGVSRDPVGTPRTKAGTQFVSSCSAAWGQPNAWRLPRNRSSSPATAQL